VNGQQPEERRVWVGAVNAILAMLENGELEPGDHLASQRAMVADLDCGLATAGLAYRTLLSSTARRCPPRSQLPLSASPCR
jgi:DNA-binding transcriptional MocR family regulator